MKKKLLYIIPDYGYLTLRMIEPLVQQGYSITVLAPFAFDFPLRFLMLFHSFSSEIRKIKRRYENWKKIDKTKITLKSVSSFRLFKQIISDIKNKKFVLVNTFKRLIEIDLLKVTNFEEYDYIWAFDTSALLYFSGAKKAGKCCILESRGVHIDYALKVAKQINHQYNTNLEDIDNYVNNPSNIQWFGKIRDEVKFADFIVTYSTFHGQQFIEEGFSKEKILQIPLGSAFQKTVSIPKVTDNVRFLFVGTLEYRKGFAGLVQAWELLLKEIDENKKVECILVGNVFDSVKHIAENLPPKMIYKGYMFHNQLKEEFSKAHVFVFPTLNDSYAMVVQEALSFNLPVVTTVNCGAADFVENNKNGFVLQNPFDVVELKNAMLKFIQNPNLVEIMGEENSKRAAFSFISEKNIALSELQKIS